MVSLVHLIVPTVVLLIVLFTPLVHHLPPVLPVSAGGHHHHLLPVVKVVQRVAGVGADPMHVTLTPQKVVENLVRNAFFIICDKPCAGPGYLKCKEVFVSDGEDVVQEEPRRPAQLRVLLVEQGEGNIKPRPVVLGGNAGLHRAEMI